MCGWLCWLNENGGAVTGVATVAGVIVAAAYSVFAALQWRATKRQADLTQRTFEATNRPYLSLRIVGEETSWADNDAVKVQAMVENVGTIPAEVTKWEVSGRLMNLEGAQEPVKVVEDRTLRSDSVFPRDPYPVEFEFKHPGIFRTALPLRFVVTLGYRGVSLPEKAYETVLEADRLSPTTHRQRTRAT